MMDVFGLRLGKRRWWLGSGPSKGGSEGEKWSDSRYISKLEQTGFTDGLDERWPLQHAQPLATKGMLFPAWIVSEKLLNFFIWQGNGEGRPETRLCILEPGDLSVGMFAESHHGCSPWMEMDVSRRTGDSPSAGVSTNSIAFYHTWLSVTSLSFS